MIKLKIYKTTLETEKLFRHDLTKKGFWITDQIDLAAPFTHNIELATYVKYIGNAQRLRIGQETISKQGLTDARSYFECVFVLSIT